MRRRTLRTAIGSAIVVAIAITLVGTASAASTSALGKQRVLRFYAQVAPVTPLDGADVKVVDADGNIVGTGRTVNAGGGEITLSKGRLPFTLTTSGGSVRGRPFEGHLQAVTSRTTRADGPLYVSFVTTVAAQFRAQHGGKVRDIEQRIYKRLGLSRRLGWFQANYGVRTLRGAALLRKARAAGGYDAGVADLVARLADGRPFPNFGGGPADRHPTYAPSTRASSTAPCPTGVVPPEKPNGTQEVVNYGLLAGSALLTAFADSDPYILLEGTVGMVAGEGNTDISNSQLLATIGNQLTCISQQISQLGIAVDGLSLQTGLSNLTTCESDIAGTWSGYQKQITLASANPNNPTYELTPDNGSWDSLMSGTGDINAMQKACNIIINQTLFSTSGSQAPVWPILVANTVKGDYVSTDKTALLPSSVQNMQYFLQYYGTLEYQQTALAVDSYNYQSQVSGKPFQSKQVIALGAPCVLHAPSLADVEANGEASGLCQWQQNILDVWPSDAYSDEVIAWQKNTSNDPNSVGGLAISAVPGIFGVSTTAYNQAPATLTPRYLNGQPMNKYDSRWNAANAWASFNNQPATTYTVPNQAYFSRQAPATGSPVYNDLSGYATFASFFNAWLNAKPSTTTPGAITPGSTSDSGYKTYQILFADGELDGSSSNPDRVCGDTKTTNTTDGTNTYTFGYYTAHNAVYSPSPWTKNTGGTLGGGSKTTTIVGTTSTVQPATGGCQTNPPIAWLKSRPWTQGTVAPGTPVIAVPANNAASAKATMSAANCPSNGCTWTMTSSSVTTGPALSSSGTFSWPGAKPGQTATVEIVAAAPVPTQVMPGTTVLMYSLPVTLTITA